MNNDKFEFVRNFIELLDYIEELEEELQFYKEANKEKNIEISKSRDAIHVRSWNDALALAIDFVKSHKGFTADAFVYNFRNMMREGKRW